MDISVGTLVECIDDSWAPLAFNEIAPQLGHTYTVREVVCYPEFDEAGLLLQEIVNSPRAYSDSIGECTFDIDCFRPVRDDQIDVFRKLAAPLDEVMA